MLSRAIVDQKDSYMEDKDKLHEVKMSRTQDRIKTHEEKKSQIIEELSEQGKLMVNLASEKGASERVWM